VQLKLLRNFIEEKTRDSKENESIIVCGDLNVNGAVVDKKSNKFAELISKYPDYNLALDDFAREYNVMMDILSNNDEDKVVDVLREAHMGQSPVTFGDVRVDEHGQIHPLETQMV
jgi:exonuclease III